MTIIWLFNFEHSAVVKQAIWEELHKRPNGSSELTAVLEARLPDQLGVPCRLPFISITNDEDREDVADFGDDVQAVRTALQKLSLDKGQIGENISLHTQFGICGIKA